MYFVRLPLSYFVENLLFGSKEEAAFLLRRYVMPSQTDSLGFINLKSLPFEIVVHGALLR